MWYGLTGSHFRRTGIIWKTQSKALLICLFS
ncbi:hypothetical protein Gotur_006312 [Gossypium turneri]